MRPNVQAAIESVNAKWGDVFAELKDEPTSAARRRVATPPIPPIPLKPLVPVEDWGGDFDVPAEAFFRFEASYYRAHEAIRTGDWRAFPEARVK